MAEALEINSDSKNGIFMLHLKGVITEDSKLEGMLPKDAVPACVVDLGQVTRINSYGIRQWVNTLKLLKEKAPELVFTKCPTVLVEQFNMISNFGAGGYVYSFFLPFYSETEDKEEQILVSLEKPRGSEDADAIIEEAKSRLSQPDAFVFNDIEDEYFSFLQFQKQKSLSAQVLAVL